MNLSERITAFTELGIFFSQFSTQKIENKYTTEKNQLFFDAFEMQINRAKEFNGWFTKENVLKSIESWTEALTEENLTKWTSAYDFSKLDTSKTVAVIMAGNIPLVGFHDFLSVLISGHSIIVKQSSNDKHFLPLIAKFLEYTNEDFKGRISFTEGGLENYDAVIATGSNNTARYFEHYFGNHPNIIRKSRNSCAILDGTEAHEELELLGEDIFQYFGLGCRSVSKLFVPRDYNFEPLFRGLFKYKDIINYKKYENNYDYNKAVYMMSLFKIQENGFVMLKEDENYASPIATVFYEFYDDLDILKKRLKEESEQIQCIVSNENVVDFVKFGQTQHPKLWNYADNVDSIEFLLNI